jgi:hypothetical protein
MRLTSIMALSVASVLALAAGPLKAEESSAPPVRHSWTERMAALSAEVSELEPIAAQAQGEVVRLEAEAGVLRARTARYPVLAQGATLMRSHGVWLILPTFLVLWLMLLFRPGLISRYFERGTLHEAFGIKHWFLRTGSPVARYVVAGVILLLAFAFSTAAFARGNAPGWGEASAYSKPRLPASAVSGTPTVVEPTPLTMEEALAIVQQILGASGDEKLIAKLEFLRQSLGQSTSMDRPKDFPSGYPVVRRVVSGSPAHLTTLAILYLMRDDATKAAKLDGAIVASAPVDWRGDTAIFMAEVLKMSSNKDAIALFPYLQKAFSERTKEVVLLIDVASAVTDAAVAARFVDAAEKLARPPEEVLLVLGYRKAHGGMADLDEKLDKLKKSLANTRSGKALADVYVAATKYDFPDLATEMLGRLREAKISTREALYFLTRALTVGKEAEALPLLSKALGTENDISTLFDALDAARSIPSTTVEEDATRRLLTVAEAAYNFPMAVLAGLHGRSLTTVTGSAFQMGLRKARWKGECNVLVEFAQQNLTTTHVDMALMRLVDFINSTRELKDLLKLALEQKKLPIALAAARNLVAKPNGAFETVVPPDYLVPAGERAFYDDPVYVRTVANLLRNALGETGAVEDQWAFARSAIEFIVFADTQNAAPALAKLRTNDVSVLGLLLGAGQYKTLSEFVIGPLVDAFIATLGLDAPIPKSMKADWARLTQARERLKEQIATAGVAKEDLVAGMPKLGAAAKAHEKLLLKGAVGAVALLLLALMALFIQLTAATLAARRAAEFRTSAFVGKWGEMTGWQCCITVLLMPIGLLIILSSQLVEVVFATNRHVSRIPVPPPAETSIL